MHTTKPFHENNDDIKPKKKDKSYACKRIKLTISKDLTLKKNAFDIITNLWFWKYLLRVLKIIKYACPCAFKKF